MISIQKIRDDKSSVAKELSKKDKSISLREGSAWLEFRTGRKLSYQGLKNKIDKDARLGN